MISIVYAKGDATRPQAPGPKVIAHICNDLGSWGKGFVLAVSKRWPEPEADFRAQPTYELGTVRLVEVEPALWVANMVAQHGIHRRNAGPPIRYTAVEQCLSKLAEEAELRQATVHLPRIGVGLAGGTWPRIEPLILETLSTRNIPVTVYDLT